jgi:tRNA(Ile)-lysidine synthase
MEAVAPDVRAGLLRLAAEARDGVAALDVVAAVHLAQAIVDEDAASVTLSRAAIGEVAVAVAPYVWRLVIERLLGDAREFERRHYDIMRGAPVASTGAVFELPRGVRVLVDAATLTVSRRAIVSAAIPAGFEAGLPFYGAVGAWRIGVAPMGDAVGGASAVVLPSGAVVRGRRPGDRMQPLGMRGHKKLQDYYVDRKIARRHRDAAPVIACGGDVLWTPFGAAESAGVGARYRIRAERMTSPGGSA